MTYYCPCRMDDPGGVVAGPGGVDGPLIGTRPPGSWGRSLRNVGAGSRRQTGDRARRRRGEAMRCTAITRCFLGLDVGKDGHHAVALNRDGKRLHDATLVNTEATL